MYKNPYTIDYSARADAKEANELFVQRWSPRALKKTALPNDVLNAVFNAARLAPSAYNEQPWRILASTEKSFDTFLGLLNEFNQSWAKDASVIGFFVAKKQNEKNEENTTALFDTGAAWMSMTLQARLLGLYTHGMVGMDFDGIYKQFGINKARYQVVAAFAIGVLADPSSLPDGLKEREKPSPRKPLAEIYFPDGKASLQ